MKFFIKIIIALLVLVLLSSAGYLYFISSYNKKIYHEAKDVPEHYAVLVLGAQIQGRKPSYMLYERVKAAAELYKADKVKKIIMSGDNRYEYHNEPQVMIDSGLELGIEESVLQPDYAGRSTYESCYRAKHIFKQDEIIIISQKYHLPRAIFLCEQLGIEAVGFEAENSYGLEIWDIRREILATLLAFYEIHFDPRETVGGDPISI